MTLPVHLTLWVTSRCNLHCAHCSQKSAMETDPDYTMSIEELGAFIYFSKQWDIRYATIELTGGEPTLWPEIEVGVQMLQHSGLTDWLTTVTNGRNAHEFAKLFQQYMPFYGVSSSQATPEQVAIHQAFNPGIFLNSHKHKPIPKDPIPQTLPARCCAATNRRGDSVLPLTYYQRRIYHCCNALSLGGLKYSIPFDFDFLSYYQSEPRDRDICSRCVCNENVWNQVT